MSRGEGWLSRVGWLLLVTVSVWPIVPQLVVLVPALQPLEVLLRPWFDLHCHRDPARTPLVSGVAFAVCARCSGIYFGLGAGAAFRRPALPSRALRFWVLGAAALMLADVALEQRGLHGAWTWARLATGFLLAYPVGVTLGQALRPRGRPWGAV